MLQVVAFEDGQLDDYAQGTAVVTRDDFSIAELSASAAASSAPNAAGHQLLEQQPTSPPDTKSLPNSSSSNLTHVDSLRQTLRAPQHKDRQGDEQLPEASEALLVYA